MAIRHLSDGPVQFFRLLPVELEEGLRLQGQVQIHHLQADVSISPKQLKAVRHHRYRILLGIDPLEQSGHSRDPADLTDGLFRYFRIAGDQDDLILPEAADHQMPDPLLILITAQAAFVEHRQDLLSDRFQFLIMQRTFFDDDRDVGSLAVHGIEELSVAFHHRQVGLVAVAEDVLAFHGLFDRSVIAGILAKRFLQKLLLVVELAGISDRHQCTAATGSLFAAAGQDPVFGLFHDLGQFSRGITAMISDLDDFGPFPGQASRHENRLAIQISDAFTVYSHLDYL